jgi:hypothetical protein
MFPGDNNERWSFDTLKNSAGRAYARDISAYLAGRAFFNAHPMEYDPAAVAAHEVGHALVLTCYGHAVTGVHLGEHGGRVTLAENDPLMKGCDGPNQQVMISHMLAMASGYIGDLVVARSSPDRALFGAAHELGPLLYEAQVFETAFSVPAHHAVRATFNECERLILREKATASQLARRLEQRGHLDAVEVSDGLKHADRATFDTWLALARAGGGQAHGELEDMLRFAALLANVGQRMYMEAA